MFCYTVFLKNTVSILLNLAEPINPATYKDYPYYLVCSSRLVDKGKRMSP